MTTCARFYGKYYTYVTSFKSFSEVYEVYYDFYFGNKENEPWKFKLLKVTELEREKSLWLQSQFSFSYKCF